MAADLDFAVAAPSPARRLRRLSLAAACGRSVPVAGGLRARLLGLAFLDREEAGPGLLIPRCAAVHTFGMRFALDVVFLDGEGRPLKLRRAVPPRRFVADRRASAVLELPAESAICGRAHPGEGGEISRLRP